MKNTKDKNASNNKIKVTKKKIYICPECFNVKKSITLNDGYTICGFCGLVVQKPPYSLESIDAPGFILKPKKKR